MNLGKCLPWGWADGRVGQRLGVYELQRRIDSGGMEHDYLTNCREISPTHGDIFIAIVRNVIGNWAWSMGTWMCQAIND